MSSNLQDHILNADTWLRFVYLVVFWFLLTVIGWVIGTIVVVQFVIVLFTGEKNPQLLSFGSRMAQYLKQVVGFMCFSTDTKPFPFSDFPYDTESKDD